MVLLLDLGNSRLKWLSHDGAERGACLWREGDQPWGEAWLELPHPERVVAVSVAGRAREARIDDWCRSHWQLAVEYLQASAHMVGLENGYRQPQQLGSDRWAALLGAWHRFRGNLLVVDAGTALTIDAVTGEGRHLGGLIVPGLTTAARALSDATDRLDMAGIGPLNSAWGRDTQSCIGNGVLQQAVAVVAHSYQALERQQGGRVEGVICGGDAALLLPHLSGSWRQVDDLVLLGVAVLAGIDEEGV